MNKKIIIWGHIPDSHTHSYVHLGFAKAFSSIDYDVVWYDDSSEYANEDLTDSIVIAEKNQCKYMPYEKSSKYFIHNIEDGFYNQSKYDGDNVYNLLVYHENYNWNENVKQINDFSWYDDTTKTVAIMWGTDLLPDEIEKQNEVLFDNSKQNVNYIGTLSQENSQSLLNVVSKNNKRFVNYGGYTGVRSKKTSYGFVDSDEMIELTKDSYLNFDIRQKCHIDNGFIPCRLFKTMSYGCWIGTNSEKISKFFDGRMTINSNISDLYYQTEEDSKNSTKEIIRDNMNYVKNNHTYLNRIDTLLSIL